MESVTNPPSEEKQQALITRARRKFLAGVGADERNAYLDKIYREARENQRELGIDDPCPNLKVEKLLVTKETAAKLLGFWADIADKGMRLNSEARDLIRRIRARAAVRFEIEQGFNTYNRDPKIETIKKILADINTGDWQFTGQPVIIDEHGNVVDSQNRLISIYLSGIPCWILFVRGVSSDVFYTIDRWAKARTVQDTLQHMNVQHSRPISAAIRLYFEYENGFMGNVSAYGYNLDSREGGCFYEKYEKVLQESYRAVGHMKEFSLGSTGTNVFLHYIFSKESQELAGAFMRAMESDVIALPPNHPIRMLRTKIDFLNKSRMKRELKRPKIVAALTIKAWNAIVKGTELKYLNWGYDRETPENFPSVSSVTVKYSEMAERLISRFGLNYSEDDDELAFG